MLAEPEDICACSADAAPPYALCAAYDRSYAQGLVLEVMGFDLKSAIMSKERAVMTFLKKSQHNFNKAQAKLCEICDLFEL